MDEVFRTWRQAPFLLLTVPLVLGMSISCPWDISLGIAVTACSLSLLTQWHSKMILLITLCFGFGNVMMHFRLNQDKAVSDARHEFKTAYIAISVDYKSKSSVLKVRGAVNQNLYHLRITPPLREIRPGDSILAPRILERTPSKPNPWAFNFNEWLRLHGIRSSVNLTANEVTIIQSEHHCLAGLAHTGRDYLAQIIDEIIPVRDYAAMAKGILLGNQDGLSQAHSTLFRSSGVMHVMAVSGLHVGLIAYLFLTLTTIPYLKSRKVFRFLIVIIGVWTFVLLTGMRPSGVRAAFMISVYFFGQLLSRKPSALNSLALAVFIMICIDPYQIWDIGFQLSVSAVLSIILFYPELERIIKTQHPYMRKVLQLLMMSLSVQFLLAPVSIYHFHQFPLNFLLSNLVAIPMATLVLGGTILSVLTYHLSAEVALGLGHIIYGILSVGTTSLLKLNTYMGWVINNLWPDTCGVIMYYLVIFSLYYGFIRRREVFRGISQLCLIGFFVYNAFYISTLRDHQGFIAYGFPHLGVIDFFEKGRVLSHGSPRSNKTPMLRSRMLGFNGDHLHLTPQRIKLTSSDFGDVLINPTSDLIHQSGESRIYVFNDPSTLSKSFWDIPDSATVITACYLSKKAKAGLTQLASSKCILWWDCRESGHWMKSNFTN